MKLFLRKKGWKSGILILILILIATTMPSSGLRAKGYIYVDDAASGKMDGSSEHPYKKIQDAIDKAAKEKKNVFIRQGIYNENIVIKEGVEVDGSGTDKTFINAKQKSEEVVEMQDDTALRKVTVRWSKENGVEVQKGASALINGCLIKENGRDGINVEEGATDNKHKVTIINNTIKNNGWAGIYSAKRKLNIEGNEILDNGKNGIDLSHASEANVDDNQIKHNGGVGIKLTLDGSEIYLKKNTIRDNETDGIEIDAKGKRGRIDIRYNKFYQNDNYGIALVEKAPFLNEYWRADVNTSIGNKFWKNHKENISPIINTYIK